MTFDDLTFSFLGLQGEQAKVMFDNGYGASVVRGPYTYGGDLGLYDLAVLAKTEGGKGRTLCYDTPITNDVIGHMTPEDVTATLAKIEALPARVPA
jgi:hypothetical protein